MRFHTYISIAIPRTIPMAFARIQDVSGFTDKKFTEKLECRYISRFVEIVHTSDGILPSSGKNTFRIDRKIIDLTARFAVSLSKRQYNIFDFPRIIPVN